MDRSEAYVRLGEEEQRLLAERELHSRELDIVGVETSVGSGVQAGDRSDLAVATQAWHQDAAAVRRIDEALAELAAARRRIDEGTYGRCEVCHAEISEERLDALPATRTCVRDAR